MIKKSAAGLGGRRESMMDTIEWTPEELRLREKFVEFYEEDYQRPTRPLDTSFMGEADNRPAKKMKWRSYAARAAAIALLVAATSITTAIFVSEDYASAVKRSIGQKIFELRNDVVIAPEGEAADENETVWEIDDMKVVSKAKSLAPQLRIPSYVPPGYEFEKLRLSQYGDGTYTGEYQYKKGDAELVIIYHSILEEGSLYMMNNDGSLELEDRTVYFWEDSITETRGANMTLDGIDVTVGGDMDELDKETLIKIAKGV
jgi:hypothetical protein